MPEVPYLDLKEYIEVEQKKNVRLVRLQNRIADWQHDVENTLAMCFAFEENEKIDGYRKRLHRLLQLRRYCIGSWCSNEFLSQKLGGAIQDGETDALVAVRNIVESMKVMSSFDHEDLQEIFSQAANEMDTIGVWKPIPIYRIFLVTRERLDDTIFRFEVALASAST